jgi:hypothetical protein
MHYHKQKTMTQTELYGVQFSFTKTIYESLNENSPGHWTEYGVQRFGTLICGTTQHMQ